MGTVMLLFALAAGGQASQGAVHFDTMAECLEQRATAMTALTELKTDDGKPPVYFAAVCVEPAKINVI